MQKHIILYIVLIVVFNCNINAQEISNSGGERLDSLYYNLLKVSLSKDKEKALEYAINAVHYAKLYNQHQIEVRATYAMALINKEKSDWDNCELYLKQAEALALQYNTLDRLPFIHELYGLMYVNTWKYDKAISSYFEVIKYADKINDYQHIAVGYHQLGVIFLRLQKYDQALNNFQNSLNYRINHNLENIELNKLNIAICYSRLSKYQQALEIFHELHPIIDNFKDEMKIELLNGLGYCHLMLNEFHSAKKYFKSSIDQIDEKNKEKYVTIYSFLSNLYKKENKIDSSIYYLVKSLDYAKKFKYAPIIASNSKILAKYYSEAGDYELAYETINEAFTLHDSIFSADLSEEIRNSFLDYQQYQSDKVISSKDLTIQRSNQFMIMLGIIVGLMIIILAFAWRTLTFRRHLNEKLDVMVQQKTSELLETNKNLIRSRKELDSFLYRTSHDIRGPIATLLGLTSLAKIEANDTVMSSYLDKINQTGEKLNVVINRLTNVSQINSQPIDIQDTNIYHMVDEVIKNLKLEKNGVSFRFTAKTPVDVKTDKILVKIILENLLENSFKFYDQLEKKPFVYLEIEQNGRLEFTVTDNGVGIDPEYSDRVFELFFVANDKNRGAGIGLYQSLLATEKLNGIISLETNKKPTRFKVSIPLAGNQDQEPEIYT